MKLMIISDLHGLKTNLFKIKEKIKELDCEKIIVLGDIYYSGIRNITNPYYDVEYIRNFLEEYKDRLICIRGNCDSKEDVEMNKFVTTKNIENINIDGLNIYLTHGHLYNENNWNKKNTILVFGHYHVPFIRKKDDNIFICVGSISLPRQNSNPSYLIYKNSEFIIYDIYDNIIDKIEA